MALVRSFGRLRVHRPVRGPRRTGTALAVALCTGALTLVAPAASSYADSFVLFSSSTPGFVANAATVPVGICFVDITADGGQGGAVPFLVTVGGHGAAVTARVPVTPGDVLAAQVGGGGGTATVAYGDLVVHTGGTGGAGGGGGGGAQSAGGGGASVVSSGGSALVVAGGGGGAGMTAGHAGGLPGGGTGDGSATGAGGNGPTSGSGGGGVTTGGSGYGTGGGGNLTVGGGGGTQLSGGGAGGAGAGVSGAAGSAVFGSVGGSGGSGNTTGGNGGTGSLEGGGGGGGGIGFGGGAGGLPDSGGGGGGYGGGASPLDGSTWYGMGGGGGGGSSYASPLATAVSMVTSGRTGDGQVTISYDPAVDACAAPDLTVTQTATGTFAQNGSVAYELSVSNIGSASTSGTIALSDAVPSAFTILSVTTSGWNCTASTTSLVSCTLATAIPAGLSAPAVTVTGSLANDTAPSVTNIATVSGGGETNTSNDESSSTTAVASSCAVGTYSATGAAPCTPAPVGTYVDTVAATSATPCPTGTFNDTIGAMFCTLAPAGHYVDIPRATVATPCPPGSFSGTTGATACTLAPAGSYVGTHGATAATPCPSGTTTPGTGATSATACTPIPQPPVFTLSTPPTTAVVGQTYGYAFLATGVPTPTYGLVGAPSWLSVDPVSGLVSGTPRTSTTTFSYSVVASNGVTPDATAGPFTVTVTTPPPTSTKADLAVTLSCPTTARAGTLLTCTLTVSNAGPAIAKSVLAALELPDRMVPISISGGGIASHEVVVWRVGTLASNTSVTYTVTTKATAAGRRWFEAAAVSSNPDPNWRNNVAGTPVTVTR